MSLSCRPHCVINEDFALLQKIQYWQVDIVSHQLRNICELTKGWVAQNALDVESLVKVIVKVKGKFRFRIPGDRQTMN